jgi:hypothetical protein
VTSEGSPKWKWNVCVKTFSRENIQAKETRAKVLRQKGVWRVRSLAKKVQSEQEESHRR